MQQKLVLKLSFIVLAIHLKMLSKIIADNY